jgi:hypothetical protein
VSVRYGCDCEDTCNNCQGWYGPGYTCGCGWEGGHEHVPGESFGEDWRADASHEEQP